MIPPRVDEKALRRTQEEPIYLQDIRKWRWAYIGLVIFYAAIVALLAGLAASEPKGSQGAQDLVLLLKIFSVPLVILILMTGYKVMRVSGYSRGKPWIAVLLHFVLFFVGVIYVLVMARKARLKTEAELQAQGIPLDQAPRRQPKRVRLCECPACGEYIYYGSEKCPHCGQPLKWMS